MEAPGGMATGDRNGAHWAMTDRFGEVRLCFATDTPCGGRGSVTQWVDYSYPAGGCQYRRVGQGHSGAEKPVAGGNP